MEVNWHAGFTGTRRGMTRAQRHALRILLAEAEGLGVLHHGDCVGADAQAHFEADAFNILMWVHPPTNPTHRAFLKEGALVVERAKPYLERNRDIVDKTELLIACPYEYEEQLRSGTWSTIRYAKKQNKKIIIILPDGTRR